MKFEVMFTDLSDTLTDLLSDGMTVDLPINGYSMIPLLYPYRDSVTLAAVNEPLKKYDVVLVKDGDRYYLHRIVCVGDCFTLNGDGECRCQYNVSPSQVCAVAVGFIRKGKRINTGSCGYRVYMRLWRYARLIRKPLLRLMRRYEGKDMV